MMRNIALGFAFLVTCATAHGALVTATFQEVASGSFEVYVDLDAVGGDTTGLAAMDFEVVGTPAAGIVFEPNLGLTGISSSFAPYGFTNVLSGAVGGDGSTRFAVGVAQNTSAPASMVAGIGLVEVNEARPGALRPVDTDVPALIGTLTTPAGLTAANFTNIGIAALAPSNTAAFAIEAANITVDVIPLTVGGGDPIAVGAPISGSSISLQGAFNDGTGLLANAIELTNDNPGSDPALEITSLVISDDAEGLFSATVNGTNPLAIDLGIDVAAGKNGPIRNVSALLTVNTNGGVLTYNLGARVPEPSTVALSALALVGLVGFARRKK